MAAYGKGSWSVKTPEKTVPGIGWGKIPGKIVYYFAKISRVIYVSTVLER